MKQSPYFNINYGWPRGTDGWDTGMNENLLVLSFLDTQRVISIVPSVPDNPAAGDAYVVSSDNSARFYADGVWNIVYPADGWEFTTSQDNATWVFEGGIPVQRVSPDDLSSAVNQLDIRVTDAEDQIGGLTDSVENLVDLPDRVQTLEEDILTKTDTVEFEDLSTRVNVLEDFTDGLGPTFNAINSNISDLQGSVQGINEELDLKVVSVVPGDGISVDITDPVNPVVSLDTSVLSAVAVSGSYNDLADTPTLGSAATQDASAFDPTGSAAQSLIDANAYTDTAVGDLSDALTLALDGRMSSAARDAVDALDPGTATLSDLITALQS